MQYFASNEYVKEKVAQAVDHRDISIVDALATKYLDDVEGGRGEENWTFPHHYKESKLFLNTYTRILAEELLAKRENEKVLVNAMCPGLFTSDMSKRMTAAYDPAVVKQIIAKFGLMTATEAAAAPVWLALLPKENYPYGQFFIKHKLNSTF